MKLQDDHVQNGILHAFLVRGTASDMQTGRETLVEKLWRWYDEFREKMPLFAMCKTFVQSREFAFVIAGERVCLSVSMCVHVRVVSLGLS